jgi:hypothetical protein
MNQIIPAPRRPVAPPPRILRARPVAVHTRRRKQAHIRLWLPVTPIAVLLSPLAVLALPVVAIGDAARRTHLAATLVNFTRVFLSMRGTEVAVQSRKANIHIWFF